MSESQFHAATKAEMKRQEQLLKILREQGSRQMVVTPPVAPTIMPTQAVAPKEGASTQHVAGKVLHGTGEFNVPRLPDGRSVDKFFHDAGQRISFRREALKNEAARERAEADRAREKAMQDQKEQKAIDDKREKLKEGTPDQQRRRDKERDRVDREKKWFDNQRCEDNNRRMRDQKRKEGEGFSAF